MHPALFLEEILRVIFSYRYAEIWHPGERHPRVDLLSLATTCRTFKNPALDLLWMNLFNLSHLVRCLHNACHVKDMGGGKRIYALERDLEPAEADIMKSYARRVRILAILSRDTQVYPIDPDTLRYLCRTSPIEPLFPNLRQLHISVTKDTIALFPHIAIGNLRKLTLLFSLSDPSAGGDIMRSLSSSCPGIQDICVHFSREWSLTTFSDVMIWNIRHWVHLRSIACPNMTMDIDTFFHLSRLPSLTRLSFAVDSALIDQIKTSKHKFVLPALQDMTLRITSMAFDSDSTFLTQMRLPTLKCIYVYYNRSLTREMIRSFVMALRTACSHKLVTNITLDSSASFIPHIVQPTMLVLEDVLPFAAFNITDMRIELNWIVDIKDDDLLRLASDCPRIESLSINSQFGWRSPGITPVGLLRVLRLRPSLWNLSVTLDTRGYPIPPRSELESESFVGGGLGGPLLSGHSWFLDLVDSVIEAESVPALAAFFADCMPSGDVFAISSWGSDTVKRLHNNWNVYEKRWRDVQRMAEEMIIERSKCLRSLGEVSAHMDVCISSS